ncbi:methyltransferase domain protein [Ancylostoma caninum]|uniref:Methyltransferase domain protein n=1 Tax=Ancylostoma caninum TaxID=29170 RepID=A0A368FM85_ANCCA|nr:methyltransferase domain protein [Ancylostoma caninum]
MMCLDVGCGKGFHAAFLAQNFPKSNFTGIDVTLEAVHLANQQRKDNGEMFDNLAFVQMDGSKMDADWTDKFDLVTIFDACHDQMRPDLVSYVRKIMKRAMVSLLELMTVGS